MTSNTVIKSKSKKAVLITLKAIFNETLPKRHHAWLIKYVNKLGC